MLTGRIIVLITNNIARTMRSIYTSMPYKERKAGISSTSPKMENSLFLIQLPMKLLNTRRLYVKMASTNGVSKQKKLTVTLPRKILMGTCFENR